MWYLILWLWRGEIDVYLTRMLKKMRMSVELRSRFVPPSFFNFVRDKTIALSSLMKFRITSVRCPSMIVVKLERFIPNNFCSCVTTRTPSICHGLFVVGHTSDKIKIGSK